MILDEKVLMDKNNQFLEKSKTIIKIILILNVLFVKEKFI
jgi:hypothetical protein